MQAEAVVNGLSELLHHLKPSLDERTSLDTLEEAALKLEETNESFHK